ncbi:response regulator transcription factor [Halobacillus kuroshimensis]|uniref:response regulator transcription factor n=1 Tax=Halobacillus kuroshimensis TaxID=302481 RepID=UPI0003FC66B9|nr:response regulator [Halobacillus kuroshimensis]
MYQAITVDDEKLIKRSIAALIRANDTGFEIVGEAKDGCEALQLQEEANPDLVITDIRMPKMNGLNFIKKVKERNPHTKFIIISGYDEFEYAQTAIRYGVVDFLLKPIKPDQFLSSLRKVYRQLENDHTSSKQRSECLLMIKSYAESLGEHLWLLEEDQVFQATEELSEKLNHLQVHPDVMRGMYSDLTVYLQGELEVHHSPFHSHPLFTDVDFSRERIEMTAELNRLCHAVLEEIKSFRNIGHRNSIRTAVRYIEANFTEKNLTLSEVADTIHMSSSYFSMEFKSEVGVSFKQYLTNLKIEKAKELLNNPLYKTYEIAEDLGYSDYPHFTKTFKKQLGMTPTQYRKRKGIS